MKDVPDWFLTEAEKVTNQKIREETGLDKVISRLNSTVPTMEATVKTKKRGRPKKKSTRKKKSVEILATVTEISPFESVEDEGGVATQEI